MKRIAKVFVRVYRSLGGKLAISDSSLDDLTYRGGDRFSPQIDPDLHTGLIEISSPGGWDRELDIYIEHDDPYPFTVLGILATMGNK